MHLVIAQKQKSFLLLILLKILDVLLQLLGYFLYKNKRPITNTSAIDFLYLKTISNYNST